MRRLFSLFNVLALLALGAAAYAYQVVQRPAELPTPPKLELLERHGVKLKVYYSDQQVKTLFLCMLPDRLDGLPVGVKIGQQGNFHVELSDKAPIV